MPAAGEFDFSLTGSEDGELDRLLREAEAEDGGADASFGGGANRGHAEPPRNPVSRAGDLWILRLRFDPGKLGGSHPIDRRLISLVEQ